MNDKGFGKGSHLHLIDGSAFIFRAYHALPPLTRKSDGLPVGAVAGFCNMIWKYIDDAKGSDAPTHAARVKAEFGDGPTRQARPGANRGDNLTGDSPYQDTPAPAGAAFGLGRKEA